MSLPVSPLSQRMAKENAARRQWVCRQNMHCRFLEKGQTERKHRLVANNGGISCGDSDGHID